MATALSLTRDQIIQAAYERIRAVAPQVAATTNQVTSAATILNGLIKVLDAVPQITSKRATAKKTVAITAGDKSVTLAAGADWVQGAQYVNGSTGAIQPLKPMTRKEWIEAGNDKTTPDQDTPTHYYVTNNNGQKLLYVYKSPAANGSIDYWTKDQVDLFDNASDTGDLPDRYTIWLITQLAAELAFNNQFRLEEIDRLQSRADFYWQVIMAGEGEHTDRDVSDGENPMKRGN